MKLVEVAKGAVLAEVRAIRSINEVLAEFLGWILIAVLREFGAVIDDRTAKLEVRRLRAMVRNSDGGEK
jgi:hypothetical protein